MTNTRQYHGISWGAGALGRHSKADKSVIERVRQARANMAAAGTPYGEAKVEFEQAA